MTDTPIQILYVDDEPALLEIGRLFLEKSGDITVRIAESPHEGVRLLEDHAVDAIVSDYQMPHCDGIAFLKYVRSKGDTTPFIIFTGKGREDVVIEALNNGADFYLQKGGNPKAQFAELLNKIRYAVGKRRSEEALAASEKQFNLLFKHMNAGFALHEILLDTSGKPIDYRFLAINTAFEKLTGLSADTLIGRTVREVMPGTEEYWISTYGEVALTGAPRQFEDYSAALGKWYDVLAYSPAYGQFAVSIQDVTERRTAEEKLRRSHDELHAANEQLAAAEEELRQQLDDLTEAQHALDETNEYLENLITYANAPIIVWDRSCRITRFNDAFGRLTGMLPEEAIGKEIQVLFPDDTRDASMALIKRAMTGEQWDIVEIPIRNTSGEIRTVLWNSANIRGGDGEAIIATIAQGQDITTRKAAEDALRRSEAQFRSLADAIEDVVIRIDRDHRHIYVNRAVEGQIGLKPDDLIGRTHREAGFTIELVVRWEEMVDSVFSDGERQQSEFQLQNGTWIDIIAAPEYSSSGEIVSVIMNGRDITARKQAEEALAEQLIFQQALIDSIPHPIFIKDRLGKFVGCNRAYERVFGTTRAYLNRKTVLDLEYLPNDERQRFHAEDMRVIGEVTQLSYELPIVYADGKVHRTLYSVDGFRLGDGSPGGLIGMLVDISDRRQMEESLQRVNQKLNLLSSITRHDINNQLTVLKGFLDILTTKNQQSEITTFIKRIDTAAEKISAMISFTKDYEGIGAAMPVWQNLRGLIDQATVQSQPGTPVVQNEIPGDREVFADPLILKVIENLIDNAVRHGGDITRIFFSLHEKEKNLLIICEDDGQGIVTAWKERIFDQGFGQNTGFGLTLSREILAITGITIRETGVHGKGARFEITVPDGGWRRVEER